MDVEVGVVEAEGVEVGGGEGEFAFDFVDDGEFGEFDVKDFEVHGGEGEGEGVFGDEGGVFELELDFCEAGDFFLVDVEV